MKEHCNLVHYVNPEEFNNNIFDKDYFDVLDMNIDKKDDNKPYFRTFIEELIIYIHGTPNSVIDKEERIYKRLKERYETGSK